MKGFLKAGCIFVNGKKITQYDAFVPKGSTLEIHKENKTHKKCPLPILFEDEDFIVIDKPAGLLSIGTSKEKEKTAYHILRTFIKERGRKEKLFILHRLDKETSGILVFTKNERIKQALQNNWNQLVKERSYFAIVEGKVKPQETLRFSLQETKDFRMKVVPKEEGKLAITKYCCQEQGPCYALLKITIDTGRKNQIRTSLAHIGNPVLGDRKYGGKKEKRLYLHADKLVFVHPFTKKEYVFASKVPSSWKSLVQEKTLRA